jgi:hypothetical protein
MTIELLAQAIRQLSSVVLAHEKQDYGTVPSYR